MSIKWRWVLILAFFAILIVSGYFLVSRFILLLNEGPGNSVIAGAYTPRSNYILGENTLLFLGGLGSIICSGLVLAWLIFTREDSL